MYFTSVYELFQVWVRFLDRNMEKWYTEKIAQFELIQMMFWREALKFSKSFHLYSRSLQNEIINCKNSNPLPDKGWSNDKNVSPRADKCWTVRKAASEASIWKSFLISSAWWFLHIFISMKPKSNTVRTPIRARLRRFEAIAAHKIGRFGLRPRRHENAIERREKNVRNTPWPIGIYPSTQGSSVSWTLASVLLLEFSTYEKLKRSEETLRMMKFLERQNGYRPHARKQQSVDYAINQS